MTSQNKNMQQAFQTIFLLHKMKAADFGGTLIKEKRKKKIIELGPV